MFEYNMKIYATSGVNTRIAKNKQVLFLFVIVQYFGIMSMLFYEKDV